MRTCLGFCLALVLWSTPAPGREIFVDNVSGDDRFTGQQSRSTADLSGPVRTIAKALRLAGAGDVIVLAKTNAPYRESISLVGSRHSGTAKEPVHDPRQRRHSGRLRPGACKGMGILQGGDLPFPPAADRLPAIVPRRPAGGAGGRGSGDRSRSAPPELKPRQWCLLGAYIYFCVERTKLPADYQLTYTRQQTGITLYHVDYATIADLTVQGFQVDGINLFNTARHVSLLDVRCRDNGRSGVAVGGASSVAIEGSRLGGNGQAQLLTLPYSETHLHNTELLSDTAPAWVDQGGRVYRDAELLEGGRDQFRPAAKREQKP